MRTHSETKRISESDWKWGGCQDRSALPGRSGDMLSLLDYQAAQAVVNLAFDLTDSSCTEKDMLGERALRNFR